MSRTPIRTPDIVVPLPLVFLLEILVQSTLATFPLLLLAAICCCFLLMLFSGCTLFGFARAVVLVVVVEELIFDRVVFF